MRRRKVYKGYQPMNVYVESRVRAFFFFFFFDGLMYLFML